MKHKHKMKHLRNITIKLRKNSKDETNGRSGNGNGESLLAPSNPYEQTKIDSASKAFDDATQSYVDRIENLKKTKDRV